MTKGNSRNMTSNQATTDSFPSSRLEEDRAQAETEGTVRFGAKLRHSRLLQGRTLRELAAVLGCSESMLSKVENDKLTPSISFLHRLANALDTSIAELFAEADAPTGAVHLFQAGKRARIVIDANAGEHGVWYERILPLTNGALLQALIHNIAPGVRSDGDTTHIGEELGYLISGELDVIVDGVTYPMKPGDVIFFPSTLSHGYYNRGASDARLLKVNTPPTL